MRRRYVGNLICPICGVRHRKYPLKCVTDANRGYDIKTFTRYDATIINDFREYCINMSFIPRAESAPIRNTRNNDDWYISVEEENNKAFFTLPKELFTL